MAGWRIVALVAGRELRQRGRSRAFIGVTLVFALAIAILAAMPGLSATVLDDEQAPPGPDVRVGIVGVALDDLDPAVRTAFEVTVEPGVDLVALDDEAAASSALEAGEVAFAYDPDGSRLLTAATASPFSIGVPRSVSDALGLATAARDADVDAQLLEELLRAEGPPVEVVATEGGNDPDEVGTRFAIAYVGAVLLYFFLVFSANLIVTGIVEEKGSRIVELLLPAAPARQLMAGKVIGLGLVGAIQAAVIVLPATAILVLAGAGPPASELVAAAAAVLVAFVLGFGLYAGVTAGLSSLVSRIEDSQVALLPLYAVLIVAFLVTFPVLGAPDSTLAQVATFVPFTAPFVVPARTVLVDLPWWHVALSAAGVVVTAALLTRLAARLYEGSILRAGARVRMREALRDRDR